MNHRCLRLVVVWLTLLGASPALAFDFSDATAGFALTLVPEPGEQLCVAWPRRHVEPAACAGVDLEAFARIEDVEGPRLVGVGVLRRGDRVLVVMVQRDEARGVDATKGEEYLGGALDAVANQGGTVSRKAHRVARVADRDAVQLDYSATFEKGPSALRSYFVPAGRISYVVSFTSNHGDSAWVDAVAARALPTLAADAPSASSDKRAAQQWRDVGYHLGMAGVGFAVLVVGLVWLLRRKRPQPVPPGAWTGPYPFQPPPPNYGQPPPPPHYDHRPR